MMISTKMLFLGGMSLLLPVFAAQNAQAYSAVADFSSTNPNGVWSYGYNVTNPLGSPTLLDQYIAGAFGSLNAWHNAGGSCCGGSTGNNSVLIGKNTSGASLSYETIVQPTNYLEQDPESNASADLVFTANKAGTYNISFGFLGIDTQAAANGAGHAVDVLKNGIVVKTGFINGYGSTFDGTFSTVLSAGQTLDFQTLTSPSTYAYLSTGVSADVSLSAVPLPASAPMFGAALLALGAVGYGVKRKKASAAA